MKKKALPFVLSLLLFSFLVAGSYGQSLTTTTESYTPGTTMNLDLTVDAGSGYVNQVDLSFDNLIDVNLASSSDKIIWSTNPTKYLNRDDNSADHTVVYKNGSPPIGTSQEFQVNVTIDAGFVGDLVISWEYTLFGSGATVNGTLSIPQASSVNNPEDVTALPNGIASIDLSWALNANSDDVMIAYNTINTFGEPTGSYLVDDEITGGGTVIYNGSGTSFSHTSLNTGAMYYYKAFSISSGKENSYSDGVEVSSMTALNGSMTEGFEDGGAMPEGWTVVTGDGDSPWEMKIPGYDGLYSATVNQTNANPKDAWLFSQPVYLEAGDYILDFYYRAGNSDDTETMDIKFGTSPNSSMTGTVDSDFEFDNITWQLFHESFTIPTTDIYYLGFHAKSAANGDKIKIDDINLGTGTAGLWLGKISSDWTNPNNWDDLNVPDATTDVSIQDVSATGDLFPIIAATKTANCNNLTIAPDAVLTVNLGGILNIGGDLLIKSEYNNGSTTGSFVDQTVAGVTITGSSTVQQAMLGAEVPAHDQWHLISSPVGSFNSSDVFWNCFLRTFDEASGAYVNVGEGSTQNTAMKGYATMYYYGGGASSTKELSFSGTLNTGDKNINCTLTDGQSGWNLVGNPYPSAVDWDLVDTDIPANLNKTFYVFDGATQAFKYYLKGGEGNTATQYLPAMQGFFVECNNAAGATLEFTNTYRASVQKSFLKNENSNQNVITLKVSGNEIDDQTTIYFKDQTTAGFDRDFDVHKMFTAAVKPPQIYSTQSNEFFAVNAYDENNRPDEVNIGFLSGLSGSYTISIPNTDLVDSDIALLLYDTKEDVHIDLRQMENYSFSYDVNDDPNRFKLQLSTTSVDEQNIFPFNIWVSGSQLTINTNNQDIQSIKVFDLTGRLIINQENLSGEGQYQMQLPEVSTVYIVEIQTVDGVYLRKVVK